MRFACDSDRRENRSVELFNQGVAAWDNDNHLWARMYFHRAIGKCLSRAFNAGEFIRREGEYLPQIDAPKTHAEKTSRNYKVKMFALSNHYFKKARRAEVIEPELYTSIGNNYHDMAALTCDPVKREAYRTAESDFKTRAQRLRSAQLTDGSPKVRRPLTLS